MGGGNYDLILADGGRVEFRVDSPPPPDTSYTLTATRIIDPHGLVTLLERDASHRLKKITEPGGRYLEITYHTYYDWVPWPAPGGTQASYVISKVEAFARPGQLIEQVDYIYSRRICSGIYLSQTGSCELRRWRPGHLHLFSARCPGPAVYHPRSELFRADEDLRRPARSGPHGQDRV